MQIRILSADKQPIQLILPTALILNQFSALFISRVLKAHNICITPNQLGNVIRVLNVYRKTHSKWVLVEVNSADGDQVSIRL